MSVVERIYSPMHILVSLKSSSKFVTGDRLAAAWKNVNINITRDLHPYVAELLQLMC
jgi:hypothetical protein